MANEQKCNGWTNYETWAVNLWLGNDEGTYSYSMELTQEADSIGELAESIKNFIEENNPLAESATLYSDLLGAAISECDWYEIAEHYWEDYKEEEEEESED